MRSSGDFVDYEISGYTILDENFINSLLNSSNFFNDLCQPAYVLFREKVPTSPKASIPNLLAPQTPLFSRQRAILNQVAYECQRGRSWLQAISLLNEIRAQSAQSILLTFEKLGAMKIIDPSNCGGPSI